jgi:hypothetical protein
MSASVLYAKLRLSSTIFGLPTFPEKGIVSEKTDRTMCMKLVQFVLESSTSTWRPTIF